MIKCGILYNGGGLQSEDATSALHSYLHMVIYCDVSDARTLWEEFSHSLSEDFLRRMSDEESFRATLNHIQTVVIANGMTMKDFCLESVESYEENSDFDSDEELKIGRTMYESLSVEQLCAANTVLDSFFFFYIC